MLIFVVPLKSSKVSRSWELTCRLLERTLKSICNQTRSSFKVVVACHEKPDITFESFHLCYTQVEFPPPKKDVNLTTKEWFMRCELDKGRKILAGIDYADRFSPTYTMAADADDCVSNRIAEFVENNAGSNGWFLGKGYFYNESTERLEFKYRKFNLFCGTSNIVRYDIVGAPSSPEYNRGYGYYRDNVIFLKHNHVRGKLEARGTPLSPLPFPGAVYITENSENIYFQDNNSIYGKRLERFLGRRRFTAKIQKEFGLYPY